MFRVGLSDTVVLLDRVPPGVTVHVFSGCIVRAGNMPDLPRLSGSALRTSQVSATRFAVEIPGSFRIESDSARQSITVDAPTRMVAIDAAVVHDRRPRFADWGRAALTYFY